MQSSSRGGMCVTSTASLWCRGAPHWLTILDYKVTGILPLKGNRHPSREIQTGGRKLTQESAVAGNSTKNVDFSILLAQPQNNLVNEGGKTRRKVRVGRCLGGNETNLLSSQASSLTGCYVLPLDATRTDKNQTGLSRSLAMGGVKILTSWVFSICLSVRSICPLDVDAHTHTYAWRSGTATKYPTTPQL